MRYALRLCDVVWLLRGGAAPGSSCADGRRLYRIQGRPVRVALTLKGGDAVTDFQVESVERAAQIRAEISRLRVDLAEMWAKVPLPFRPMVKVSAEVVACRLETLEKLTGAK